MRDFSFSAYHQQNTVPKCPFTYSVTEITYIVSNIHTKFPLNPLLHHLNVLYPEPFIPFNVNVLYTLHITILSAEKG